MRATVPSTRVHYFFRVYSPRVSRANLPYRLIFPFLCRRRGRDEKGEGRRGKAGGNFSRVAPRLSVESPSRKERLRWNWSVVFDVCGRFFFSSSFFSCFFVVVSINRFVFVRWNDLLFGINTRVSFLFRGECSSDSQRYGYLFLIGYVFD